MLRGNMPTDGGNFLMERDEAFELVTNGSVPEGFFRPFMGASEVVNAKSRYCLWIEDSKLDESLNYPVIRERIERVKQVRLNSTAPTTRATKVPPHKFMQIEGCARRYSIAIPAITSENREYLPAALLDWRAILSNKCYVLYDAPLWNFALIASKMHQVWIGTVCARMRSDFSYSNTLGWNTFPISQLTDKNKADLTRCAEDILLAREAHFPSTIADLYEVKDGVSKMPANLKEAHDRNDEVLERIYIGRRFRNDTERLEKLFELYTKMTSKSTSNKSKVGATV